MSEVAGVPEVVGVSEAVGAREVSHQCCVGVHSATNMGVFRDKQCVQCYHIVDVIR